MAVEKEGCSGSVMLFAGTWTAERRTKESKVLVT